MDLLQLCITAYHHGGPRDSSYVVLFLTACYYDILLYAAHIDIDPSILVAAVNNSRSYFFNCIPTTSQDEGGVVDIRWLINGTLLDDSDLNNVNSAFVGGVGGFGTLTFSSVQLDQNSTSVSCNVHFVSGHVEKSSDSLLLLQG